MPRDVRGGSRLLSIAALLVAIGGLVLAATALPMLTAEAPAGGSLEDSADTHGAGEEAIDRTDPETAGAAGSAAAGAAAEEPGAAADADPDERTVEEIREGVGDSDAGTALLGVAAVFATVGGAGEELPADAIDEEDVEGLEGTDGYPTGEAQERDPDDEMGVPAGLGSLGGELGELAAESAPEGEGEGPTGSVEDPEALEGVEGDAEFDAEAEDGDADAAADGSAAGDAGERGSGVLGSIPGGETTVLAAFAALLALAFAGALRGGADARSLPARLVSGVLEWVVAASRELERAVAGVRARSIGELPRAVVSAVVSALAALRGRVGARAGEPAPAAVVPAGERGDGERSAERRRIREAFAGVVAASALSRSRVRVATPDEVARRAVEAGAPREPVATITDAFRDVEYGGGDASERVERVREASEALPDRDRSGSRGRGE